MATAKKVTKKKAVTKKKITRKKPPKIATEVAPTGAVYAGVMADDYWERGWCPANPDDLVGKEGLKVYRQMMKREPVVRMALEMLERSRLSTGFRIAAGSGPRGEEIAEKTELMFSASSSKPTELFHDLLEARPMGFVLMEKVPVAYNSGPLRGLWGFRDYRSLWQEEFELGDSGFGRLDRIRHTNRSGRGKKLWRGKEIGERFIIHVPDKEKGSWYGVSILRPVYRAYLSKDYLQRSANVSADRFGGGTIWAVLPPGATSDQLTSVRDALQAHHGSPAHAFLAGTNFGVSYPPAGAFDGFVNLINSYNAEMLTGMGIPTTMLSGTGSDGQGGSLALSRTHADNYAVVVDRIGRGLEECVDDQVFRQFADWNWPDVQLDEYPHLRFGAFREQDQRLRGEVLALAQKLGMALSVKQVREDLGAVAPIGKSDTLDAPDYWGADPEDGGGGSKGKKPEDTEDGKPPDWGGEGDEANKDEREAREKYAERLETLTLREERADPDKIQAQLDSVYLAARDDMVAATEEIQRIADEVIEEKLGGDTG